VGATGFPKQLLPISLDFKPYLQAYGTIEVESFSEHERFYSVDLEEQTCTCGNFVEDRLPHVSKDHLGRWCKHLVEVLTECGALDDLDEWQKAMLAPGFGGPFYAFKVDLPTVLSMVVAINTNLEWMDVYARTKKAGEKMTNATGRIKRYGWHVSDHSWSYGEAPAGASELKPILKSFNQLSYTQIEEPKSSEPGGTPQKRRKSQSGCMSAFWVLLILGCLVTWVALQIEQPTDGGKDVPEIRAEDR